MWRAMLPRVLLEVPMFEHARQPLLDRRSFVLRLLRHLSLAGALVFIALGIGVVGYHATEDMPWIDSLLNASMLLGGMGPVDRLATVPGKLFASLYALFAGLVFVGAASIVIGPLAHRMLHRMHADRL